MFLAFVNYKDSIKCIAMSSMQFEYMGMLLMHSSRAKEQLHHISQEIWHGADYWSDMKVAPHT